MPNQSNISTEAITVNAPVEVNEVRKPSFWISQVFILIATVLGVYLAATQGFKQAVQFDNIMGQKSIYYLQKSLKNEVSNNLLATEIFIEKTKASQDQWSTYPLDYNVFIWDNITKSPTILELNPDIILNAEKFTKGLVDNYQRATTGTQDQRQMGLRKLEALVVLAKNELIPALEKNIQSIEVKMKDLNVEL